jgi:hypothetical protein
LAVELNRPFSRKNERRNNNFMKRTVEIKLHHFTPAYG